MRRKIISLSNISLFFRWVGFIVVVLGGLLTLFFIGFPIYSKIARPESAGAQPEAIGFSIGYAVGSFLATLVYAAVAFLISEMILLMLRMEVDLKQIRFSFQGGGPAPSASGVQLPPGIQLDTSDAPEIAPPIPVPPEPAKPAMDLYPEKDEAVPFDVLITPKGQSAEEEEEETTPDSSPEVPIFEPHDEPEEIPKVDTRPISYCPNCNAMIRYKPEKKGKVIKCPKCSQPFRLGVS